MSDLCHLQKTSNIYPVAHLRSNKQSIRGHILSFRKLHFVEKYFKAAANSPLHTDLIPFDGRSESTLIQMSLAEFNKVLPVSETASAAR